MILYHYTPVDLGRQIAADKLLRCYRQPLYRDMFGRDMIRESSAIVWLTKNPVNEATSWAKIFHSLPPKSRSIASLIGQVARVTVETNAARYWWDWIKGEGGPAEDWEWCHRSAVMIGGEPDLWWVCATDVSIFASNVEVLTGNATNGTTWGPLL